MERRGEWSSQRPAALGEPDDVVLVVDADGRVVVANDGARRAGAPEPGATLVGTTPLAMAALGAIDAVRAGAVPRRVAVRDPSRDQYWVLSAVPSAERPGDVRLVATDVRGAVLLDREAFLAGMVHELRNLSFTLRSVTEAAEVDAPAESELADYLPHLRGPVERLSSIVADLARYAASRERAADHLDVSRLVRDAMARVAPRIERVGVRTAAGSWADGLRVVGDGGALGDALVAMIADLAADTPSSSTIIVDVTRVGAGSAVEIVASSPDARSAILAGETSQIWEPFVRRRPPGTGLGLATARATVVAHGGAVFVRRPQGDGLSYGMTLPIVSASGDAALPSPGARRTS